MDDEAVEPLDDPPPRAVSVTWVWPGRWLLTVGDAVSTVLTGAELAVLAAEASREAGRR